jgi:hypothetical protein
MLLGPDDVADLHVEVVDDARQVVEHGTVGALNDVVLLARPRDRHLTTNVIGEFAGPFARHHQADDALAALGLEPRAIEGCLRHPLAAVDVGAFLFFGGVALGC